jgi:hypothetical protein
MYVIGYKVGLSSKLECTTCIQALGVINTSTSFSIFLMWSTCRLGSGCLSVSVCSLSLCPGRHQGQCHGAAVHHRAAGHQCGGGQERGGRPAAVCGARNPGRLQDQGQDRSGSIQAAQDTGGQPFVATCAVRILLGDLAGAGARQRLSGETSNR